jgi:hypothetical protein
VVGKSWLGESIFASSGRLQPLLVGLSSAACGLHKLCLHRAGLHPEQFKALFDSLRSNNTLVELDVQDIEVIEDPDDQEKLTRTQKEQLRACEAGPSIAAVLRNARSKLRVLKLIWCHLEPTTFQSIADALCEDSVTLSHLFLNGNMGMLDTRTDYAPAVSALAALKKMLERNFSLLHLDLHDTGMTEAGLLEVAPGLAVNSTLRVLNVAQERELLNSPFPWYEYGPFVDMEAFWNLAAPADSECVCRCSVHFEAPACLDGTRHEVAQEIPRELRSLLPDEVRDNRAQCKEFQRLQKVPTKVRLQQVRG